MLLAMKTKIAERRMGSQSADNVTMAPPRCSINFIARTFELVSRRKSMRQMLFALAGFAIGLTARSFHSHHTAPATISAKVAVHQDGRSEALQPIEWPAPIDDAKAMHRNLFLFPEEKEAPVIPA